MTFQELNKLIKDNNIPYDVKLLSDSGWECDPTDIDGVYYNRKENHLVFTQTYMNEPLSRHNYAKDNSYICLK